MADINKEISRIAKETGTDEASVKAELEKMKQQGYTDQAAMAVYKSNPKVRNRLGGKLIENAVMLPFQIDGPRDVTTKKGAANVSNISVFIQDSGKWDVKTISLWDDQIGKEMPKYEVGKPVSATIRVKDGSDRVSITTEVKPSTAPVPALTSIAEQIGLVSLNLISQLEGQSCFVKGIVGRTFTTPYGEGIEISEVGSNPLTVYLPAGSGAKIGNEVVVVGRVSNKNGAYTLRGSLL